MRSKIILLAVSVAILACASRPAFAKTIVTQYAGSAVFGGTAVGYGGGSIWPNPNDSSSARTQVGVGLGGDSFFTTDKNNSFSSTGHFNTWCVDITHWNSNAQVTYYIDGTAELAQAFNLTGGKTRVDDLHRLANEFYSLVHDTDTSAAFQQAVWAVMFGTKDNVSGKYSLDSATFTAPSGNTGSATAALWLSELGTVADKDNYDITYLNDGGGEYTQDMVVFTPSPVPEPGSLLLLGGGGLFLLGLARNRRNKAKA